MTDKATRVLVRQIAVLRKELSETKAIMTEAFERITALEQRSRNHSTGQWRNGTSPDAKQRLFEQNRSMGGRAGR